MLPRSKRFPAVKGNRLAQTFQKRETAIHIKLLSVRPFPAHTGSRYRSIEQRFQVGRISQKRLDRLIRDIKALVLHNA